MMVSPLGGPLPTISPTIAGAGLRYADPD